MAVPKRRHSNAVPSVWAVVISFRNEGSTQECVARILASTYVPVSVVIVDNTPATPGVRRIDSGGRTVVRLFIGSNVGFGPACNAGVRHALANGADFVALVNNDVKVETDTLEIMVEAMEARPEIGVMCPMVLRSAQPGTVENAGGAYNAWIGLSIYHGKGMSATELKDRIYEVGYVPGTMMMVRKDVFSDAGLMPEQYFLYVEDIDFSVRARMRGHVLSCNTYAVVHHSLSTTSARYPGLKQYYMTRNTLIFARSQTARAKLIVNVLSLPLMVSLRIFSNFREMGWLELRGFVFGMIDGMKGRVGPSQRREYAPQ